jgi:sugar O-acyltransferase (sialic acid O-acetyltransferase NeuD family)
MNEKKKIVMFGAGKIAQLCHFFISLDKSFEVVAFTVDKEYKDSETFLGLPVIDFDKVQEKYPPDNYNMFVAVGYGKLNKKRAEKCLEAKDKGYTLVSYISPDASVYGNVEMGENCFISDNTVIYPFTKIGDNVFIRSGVYIGHDIIIHDHCWISSNAAINGHVEIKPYSFIGANATIRDNVTIAEESLIGAGTTILRDTKEKGVYVAKAAEPYPLDSENFLRMMEISS